MRILFMGNNWTGWQIIRYLTESNEEIAGLVIHPVNKQKFTDEILQTAGVDPGSVFYGNKLHHQDTMDKIVDLKADIAISILFDYILKIDFIQIFPKGVINLHPSYLPFNRGQYPNVWSIIDETPSGVTLHYIDGGIDTGDIISQKKVSVDVKDTGESLYHKLEKAMLSLFRKQWPAIRESRAVSKRQISGKGTYHRSSDVIGIDEIDLDKSYTAKEFINILRARTFRPYPGAYFKAGGEKIYLRLELLSENELDEH